MSCDTNGLLERLVVSHPKVGTRPPVAAARQRGRDKNRVRGVAVGRGKSGTSKLVPILPKDARGRKFLRVSLELGHRLAPSHLTNKRGDCRCTTRKTAGQLRPVRP